MRDGGLGSTFRKYIPDAHWQSVETHGTGRGVPDFNYCLEGAEGWIEYKEVSGWRAEVRPEQVAWAEQRSRAGGRVFLAAVKKQGGWLWLFPPSAFRSVMIYGVRSEPALLEAGGGPRKWPWAAVRAILKK